MYSNPFLGETPNVFIVSLYILLEIIFSLDANSFAIFVYPSLKLAFLFFKADEGKKYKLIYEFVSILQWE